MNQTVTGLVSEGFAMVQQSMSAQGLKEHGREAAQGCRCRRSASSAAAVARIQACPALGAIRVTHASLLQRIQRAL